MCIRDRQGQKFLEYAKRIIYEIEEMKRDCSDLGKENLSFKITVPRASYISSAFAEFIGMQSKETAIKAEFQESSSMPVSYTHLIRLMRLPV